MMTKLNLSRFAFLFVGMLAITMYTPEVLAAKVDICHKSSKNGKQKTININKNAVKAHVGHGDYEGRCGEVLNSERLMFRCDVDTTTFTVIAASGSDGVSNDIEPSSLIGGDCAATQVAVQAEGCKEIGFNGTPIAQLYSYACPDDSVAIEPPPS